MTVLNTIWCYQAEARAGPVSRLANFSTKTESLAWVAGIEVLRLVEIKTNVIPRQAGSLEDDVG